MCNAQDSNQKNIGKKTTIKFVLQNGKRPSLVVEVDYDTEKREYRISHISGSSLTKLKVVAGLCAAGFVFYTVAEHVLILEAIDKTYHFLSSFLPMFM